MVIFRNKCFNIRITRIKHISLHLPDCVNSSENWRIRAWSHDACCADNTDHKQKDSFLPQDYFTCWDQNIYSSLNFEEWVKLKLSLVNSEDECTELLHNVCISVPFSKISHPRRVYSCNLKGCNWGFGSHTEVLYYSHIDFTSIAVGYGWLLFTHWLHIHSCWLREFSVRCREGNRKQMGKLHFEMETDG